jgi:hypothetical protein
VKTDGSETTPPFANQLQHANSAAAASSQFRVRSLKINADDEMIDEFKLKGGDACQSGGHGGTHGWEFSKDCSLT